MAGGSTRWQGRSVISKVVSLLDAFSPATPELSLTDLARITGLPVSTTYRLASELVEWGGLERADGSGYRIGVRLGEVGALAPRSATLRDIALPYMRDLHEATRATVQLAVLDGHEARCLETITEPGAATARRQLPLHATGVGKVLLAHAPEQLLHELAGAGLRRYTAHTLVTPGQLDRALAAVRRSGLAYAREEASLGSGSVAAPVVDSDGTVVAAVAAVLRSGHGDVRRLGAAVRTSAISTSRSLQEADRPAR